MKPIYLILLILLLPLSVKAIDCGDLKSQGEIRNFTQRSKASNPLMNENFSALIELDACEEELCRQKNRIQRVTGKQLLHIVKKGENQRVRFIKGKNSPQCYLNRGEREFRCGSCEEAVNSDCRSHKNDNSSTKIPGTNIDRDDFDLLKGQNYQSLCQKLPTAPAYFKILSTRIQGDSPYNEIISFYEKKREIPIIISFLVQGRLRKVYRFFPKQYSRLDGNWYSTIFRARTVKGDEKRFVFETLIKVLKGNAKQFQFYSKPEKDPLIKGVSDHELFKND